MRKVIAVAILCTGVALACGDKLILLIRGAHYRQVFGGRRVSILAYSPVKSAVSGIVREFEVQPALKRAGHKFYAVDGSAKFEQALRAGKYDLVMADVNDADAVERELRSVPSRPTLLPVIYNATKADEKAAARKYHCVLKAPGTPGRYLEAIDDALELRLRGGNSN
jgi:hypothetical protein